MQFFLGKGDRAMGLRIKKSSAGKRLRRLVSSDRSSLDQLALGFLIRRRGSTEKAVASYESFTVDYIRLLVRRLKTLSGSDFQNASQEGSDYDQIVTRIDRLAQNSTKRQDRKNGRRLPESGALRQTLRRLETRTENQNSAQNLVSSADIGQFAAELTSSVLRHQGHRIDADYRAMDAKLALFLLR